MILDLAVDLAARLREFPLPFTKANGIRTATTRNNVVRMTSYASTPLTKHRNTQIHCLQ